MPQTTELSTSTDSLSYLEAIDKARQDLNLHPPGVTDRSTSLTNLAISLWFHFAELGDIDSLAEAVELHRQALDLRPPGHPARSKSLNNLGTSLLASFDQLGDLESLAEAVELHRQALDLRPPGHPDRSLSLNNLAISLQTRFEQLGHMETLAEAVELHRQVLALRPQGHYFRSSSLNSLANALFTQFQHLGNLEALVEAIELHRQALDLRPPGHADRSESLNNLAAFLFTQFQQLGNLDTLAEAIELHRHALYLRPPGHLARSQSLSNLANALNTRFEQLGDLEALTEAIALHRQAIELHSLEDPDRSISLNNLAVSLWTQFQQRGDMESLAEAVNLHRLALDLRPPGHTDRSQSLNNLATTLSMRVEQLGDLNALAEAVELHRQALDLFPPGHPHRSKSLNNLANALKARYVQLGEPDALVEAAQLHRQALDLSPQGHPERSMSLNNWGNSLLTQFLQEGDLGSLSEAVELHRQSLDLRPPGHLHRISSLRNLAAALFTQSRAPSDYTKVHGMTILTQRSLSDLDEALSLCKEGLRSCACGHPERNEILFYTGVCLLRPGTHVYSFEDGIRYILEALGDPASSARQVLGNAIWAFPAVEDAYRFSAQQIATVEHSQHHHRTLLLEAYTLVIRLLPRAASFGLDHAGRLRELSGAELISRNAATWAITAGCDVEAVEMLEEGRGVFWAQAHRLRTTDLDILPAQDAHELRSLFRLLDIRSIGESSADTVERERLVEHRRHLGTKAEALIADIRSRPGTSRFLLPPTFSSLVQSLPEGYFVFLNVSELGQHALVLNGSTKSVHSLLLRLPARIVGTNRKPVKKNSSHTRDNDHGFSAGDPVQSVAEQFRAGLRERATFGDSLADLWIYIVRPIIELLPLKKSSGRDRPRVWWCATGMLTFLPIHAAGCYTKASRERVGAGDDCASDYIVSSYITSISVLLRARNGFSSMARSDVKGLLLHEGSPGRGWSSITNVKNEVSRVQERFNAAGASLTVVRPSLPDAFTYLKETHMHILHLACHGAQKNDPLASGFILRDEDMTIQDIMQLDLKHALIAFLSACQTAKGNLDQPDQAVHVAASMLFCGFKSVIATMWGMSDKDGPMIADYVYDVLFKEVKFDLNVVPYALDDAVRHMREQKIDAERWSVFMHMGA